MCLSEATGSIKMSKTSTSSNIPVASQGSNSSISQTYRRNVSYRHTTSFGGNHFIESDQRSSRKLYLDAKYGLLSLLNKTQYFWNKHIKVGWFSIIVTLIVLYMLNAYTSNTAGSASDNKLNVNDSLKVAKLELDVAGLWRGYKELTDTRLEPPMNIRNMFRSPEFVELLNKSVIERIDPMMEPVIEKVQSIEKQANRRVSQSDVLPQDSLAELNQQIRGLVMSAVEERLDRFSKSLNERLEEVLGERLRASVELNARLTFEKLMESELKTAISEQISVQTMKSVNLALKQRMKATSSMDLDETFLNNSIRAQIQSLIRDKNLDKNSKPDYASELNNAIVLDASSTYTEPNAIKLFGLPLWSLSSPPAHLLKRSTQLVETYSKPWKMDGQRGFIKIKLAKPIKPGAFAYEHLLRSSILDENQLTCSPKVFRVLGYEEGSDEPILLGRYDYEIRYDNVETEFVFENVDNKISVMQFNVEANHGNTNYTCLHKIKVF